MNPTILYDSCKKWLKRKLYPSPSSIPEYLHSLGVESLWHYPARQVIDILTDYQPVPEIRLAGYGHKGASFRKSLWKARCLPGAYPLGRTVYLFFLGSDLS